MAGLFQLEAALVACRHVTVDFDTLERVGRVEGVDAEQLGKTISLAPVQNAIKSAAAAASRALEARRAAWRRALDGLALVAQEVLE